MRKTNAITTWFVFTVLFFGGLMIFSSWAAAEETTPIRLPPPQTDGGKPLMQVLNYRDIFPGIQ
jgi:hypothetical protein